MTNTALINNRYRILETIGRGGFGETYLAEDMHMPSGRKCVLKQLKPIVQQPVIPLWMKERFQREAAILEELGAASSQIPELYAYFSEDKQFYLVQELIEGETLAQKWQRDGNLSSQQVIKMLQQILPVLEFIHDCKIVHRDIKPDNIILRRSDGLPVLIDFGAVKETLATAVPQNSHSVSAAIGTPGYMSSEQAAGRPLYSSDLYSLGLTAIFLLTGKAPQELDVNPQTGEIIWQKHASGVDDKLTAIINKAIKFHPRDRYSRASQMLQELGSTFGNAPTTQNTGATVRVAPRVAAGEQRFNGTVAYQKPKKQSWLLKVLLFFLVTGGLSIGGLVLGFATISSWWQNRPQPQVKVPDDTTAPIALPKKKPIISLPKAEVEEPEIEPEQPEIEEPAIEAIEPSQPDKIEAIVKPEKQPQPVVNAPVVTVGTSESQLVSTLGQPSTRRDNPQKNSTVSIYRNVSDGNLNATYHTDSTGRIKQADVALNQSLSLGTMQDTLNKLLAGDVTPDAKNKLRDVYNRKSDRYSFRTSTMRGSIYRDSKDRVNISVWQ